MTIVLCADLIWTRDVKVIDNRTISSSVAESIAPMNCHRRSYIVHEWKAHDAVGNQIRTWFVQWDFAPIICNGAQQIVIARTEAIPHIVHTPSRESQSIRERFMPWQNMRRIRRMTEHFARVRAKIKMI